MIFTAPIRIEAGSTKTVIDLADFYIKTSSPVTLQLSLERPRRPKDAPLNVPVPPIAFVWTWEVNERCAGLIAVIISEVTTLKYACRYLMIQKTGGAAELRIVGHEQTHTMDGKKWS